MDNYELFRTILTKHPLVKKLITVKDSESLLLFGYCYNKIYISEISLIDGLIPEKRHEFNGEVLDHSETVVDIFLQSGAYYGVDQSGHLFQLTYDSSFDGNEEYDLFEDSPERTKKWNINGTTKVTVDSFVLKICLAENGSLACLTSSATNISLEIIDITTKKFIKSFLLRKPGLLEVLNKQDCLLQWIPKEKIIPEFFTSWFREGREQTGFFLVTLPDGSILAVFPESGELEYLYIWFSPFLHSYWEVSVEKEECCLWAWSKCGGWLGLRETGEVVRGYLPAAPASLHISYHHQALYFSTLQQSFIQDLASQKYISLPLRGIVCWSGTGIHILALSRSGHIYAVGAQFSQLIDGNLQELLPDSSLTSELIRKNIAFEMINAEIAQLDRYAIALLLSKKEMHFSLKIQMLSARGGEYTVWMLICLTEGQILEKKDWTLRVSVGGPGGTYSSAHHLPASLSPSDPLVFPLAFRYPHPPHPTFLQASLVFSHIPPFTYCLPIINIGKIEMDPSYFLLPAIELDIKQVPHVPEVEDLLSNLVGFVKNETRDQESNKVMTTVNLSRDYPEESLFKNLLNNIKTLWRVSQWDKACARKVLEVAVSNKLVRLEVTDGTVKISGEDPSSCWLVKQALFSTGRCILAAEPQNIFSIEELTCWSEVLMGLEKPEEQQLEELRTRLRTTITSMLLLAPPPNV